MKEIQIPLQDGDYFTIGEAYNKKGGALRITTRGVNLHEDYTMGATLQRSEVKKAIAVMEKWLKQS